MTAQLNRIVYRVGNPENDEHHFTDKKDHADIAKKNGYEVSAYVLAGTDSEPVAWLLTDNEFGHSVVTKAGFTLNFYRSKGWLVQPLYAAPPAPVAVPDKWPEKLIWSHQDDMTQAEVLAWNNAIDACRDAVLKRGK